MVNFLFKKGMLIGIILLFIGMNMIPAMSENVRMIHSIYTIKNDGNINFINDPPEEEWNKTFGGTDTDLGHSVRQTSDNGYIITGTTGSYGSPLFSDVWLIKTDVNGDEQWNKTFGGTDDENGISGHQTIDGGYIITGITNSYGVGDYDIWLIKTDIDGNEQWNKTFGSYFFDMGYFVQQTNDNGYIIIGTKNLGTGEDEAWLIKTDSNGNEQWNKTFGGPSIERGYSGQQTSDGGYILTGPNGLDVWLIKTDSNGNEQWNKTFSLTINHDSGNSIQQTSDDGYIVSGIADADFFLLKTDSNGNKQWDKTFGGNNLDYGRSSKQTKDGGYIITGETYSNGDNWNAWLIKTDSNGNEQWNKTFGGADYEVGQSVQQTIDDGYIVAGCTGSYGSGLWDAWLIKVAADNGNPIADFIWIPSDPDPGETITFDASDSYDPDGSIVLYEWDWDDDGMFDENNPISTTTYSWDESGSYPVTLRVIDNENNTGSINYTVYVGGSQLPIADFIWMPEDPGIDETIIFDASDSYDPDGYIELYEWDWDNDGSFEESNAGPNASHSWYSFGSFPVTLRVFDDENNTDSITKIVNIIDIIVPDNYPTIQDAVDHSEEGYRILVRDGIYEENIVIDVELLTIQPLDNKGEVIIDGGGIGNVIKIEDKAFGVKISGFTIKNSGPSYAGILIDSSSNDIWDNEFVQNGQGLKIFGGNANQLHDNIIDSNILGVNIDENSHGNILKDNDIKSNTNHGIFIDELSTGNVIQDNFISDNVDSGLRFEGISKGNLVTFNDFENNKYGIYCIGSSDTNLFHHNSFVNNDNFNAWDSSVDRWDDDFEGNYWDDYTGMDNDGDGIGDTPYYIPGGDNVDRYPLINPPYSSLILEQQTNGVYKKTSSNEEYLTPSILDTIYVPGDYPTIQDAVTNSNPGDTIIVSPGIYEEHVVVDRSLIIIGANADADVIVDGSGENFHVFLVTADNVDISGFTIRDTSLGKAGVMVMGNFSVIHGNVFEDCGSGVEIFGRFNKIHDNVIQGNTMSDNHWGVYVSNCFDCLVENNANIVGNVNGIEIGYSSVEILDNVVKNSDDMGIIQQLSDNVLIRGNELSFNGLGGNNDAAAVQLLSSEDCIVDNNVISGNYQYGISVYMSSHNDFTGNVISGNSGCPFLIAFQSSDNNILNNEIETGYDFGVFVRDSNDNYFSNNDLTNSGNLDCITFRNSCQNIVEWNNFYHSPLINSNVGGFRLYSLSFDNFCFHNNFYGGCDAIDECGNDFDDACFCGNYWENYPGVDGDGDGIGDEHYDIFGGSRDDFPLMYPWDPPGKPSKPSGETNGKVGEEYSYSCSASDPNNLKICYGWDWNGDSSVDDWTGFFDSGVTGSIGHIWGDGGTFMVSVIAKNEHGQVSGWSDPLEVTMPRSKILYYSYFLRFGDLFSILQRIQTIFYELNF